MGKPARVVAAALPATGPSSGWGQLFPRAHVQPRTRCVLQLHSRPALIIARARARTRTPVLTRRSRNVPGQTHTRGRTAPTPTPGSRCGARACARPARAKAIHTRGRGTGQARTGGARRRPPAVRARATAPCSGGRLRQPSPCHAAGLAAHAPMALLFSHAGPPPLPVPVQLCISAMPGHHPAPALPAGPALPHGTLTVSCEPGGASASGAHLVQRAT